MMGFNSSKLTCSSARVRPDMSSVVVVGGRDGRDGQRLLLMLLVPAAAAALQLGLGLD